MSKETIAWLLASATALVGLLTGGFAVVMWHIDLAADVIQNRKDATFQWLEVMIADREETLIALELRLDSGELLTTTESRSMENLILSIERMNVRRNALIGIVE